RGLLGVALGASDTFSHFCFLSLSGVTTMLSIYVSKPLRVKFGGGLWKRLIGRASKGTYLDILEPPAKLRGYSVRDGTASLRRKRYQQSLLSLSRKSHRQALDAKADV